MTSPLICQFCRCTEDRACRLSTGEPCSWLNAERTVCTNPVCMKKWEAKKAAAEEAERRRTRKKTPAEIHELIRKGKRRPGRKACA